jgi:sulfite reductase (NADPH) flavoprotein alpha-component
MIMIGPGTGIAPFRAFLQERRAIGAPGRNWLFFGNPHRATDFLYEDELLEYRRDGLLTRLDTAFSRDQAEKIYVQHRLLEHAAELWAWLEDGAHLYVCGDAERMARDVDRGLAWIVAKQGRIEPAAAKAYLARLAAEGRYQRDVY